MIMKANECLSNSPMTFLYLGYLPRGEPRGLASHTLGVASGRVQQPVTRRDNTLISAHLMGLHTLISENLMGLHSNMKRPPGGEGQQGTTKYVKGRFL